MSGAWAFSPPRPPVPQPRSPKWSLLTVRAGGGFLPPAWDSDSPGWLPLLCLLPLQDPTAFPVPTFQDLAGFWDLLQLSIEDVTLKFLELQQLKANSWKLLEPKVGGGPFKPRVQILENTLPHGRMWGVGMWKLGGRRRDPKAAKAALDR